MSTTSFVAFCHVVDLLFGAKKETAIISKTAFVFTFLLGNSHLIHNQLVLIIFGNSIVPPREPREVLTYPRQLHATHSPAFTNFETFEAAA
jgi:hypothetical protein